MQLSQKEIVECVKMDFSFICRGKTRLKVREDTVLKNFPPLLPEMQAGNANQRKGFTYNRHSKAGMLTKLYTPPCMSKTIAAVFLRLSVLFNGQIK